MASLSPPYSPIFASHSGHGAHTDGGSLLGQVPSMRRCPCSATYVASRGAAKNPPLVLVVEGIRKSSGQGRIDPVLP